MLENRHDMAGPFRCSDADILAANPMIDYIFSYGIREELQSFDYIVKLFRSIPWRRRKINAKCT